MTSNFNKSSKFEIQEVGEEAQEQLKVSENVASKSKRGRSSKITSCSSSLSPSFDEESFSESVSKKSEMLRVASEIRAKREPMDSIFFFFFFFFKSIGV